MGTSKAHRESPHVRIPGPQLPAPILAAEFIVNPRNFYRRITATYGDVTRLPTLFGPFVCVTSPEAAREIFDYSPDHFSVHQPHQMYHIFGRNAMLITDGAQHKRSRKLVAPSLHGNRIERFYTHIQAKTLLHFSRRGAVKFRALDAAHDLTLAIITRIVLGITSPEEEQRVASLYKHFSDLVLAKFIFVPWLRNRWLGGETWRLAAAARVELENIIRDRIAASRATEPSDDVLSMLAHTRDEHGELLSVEEVLDDTLFLMFSGFETSSNVLAWLIREIYSRPGVLARLRHELHESAPRDSRELDRLPYLDAVINETMRFRPITTEIIRHVNRAISVRGHHIPAGHVLLVATSAIHETASLFESPHKFDPDRFLRRKFESHQFLPFGGGHRRCLGATFAMFELKTAISTIVQNFDITPFQLEDVRTKRLIVIESPKSGVPIKAVPRYAVRPTFQRISD